MTVNSSTQLKTTDIALFPFGAAETPPRRKAPVARALITTHAHVAYAPCQTSLTADDKSVQQDESSCTGSGMLLGRRDDAPGPNVSTSEDSNDFKRLTSKFE
eukprot:6388585-Prymnesium_polylepis.1